MINWLSSHFALFSASSLSLFHSASAADIYNVGKPQGHVDIVDILPSPQEFYTKYVKNTGGPFAGFGKPALFRGAAKFMPAYQKWTDEYLKTTHGKVKLDQVETEKKETRTKLPKIGWTIAKFLKEYKTKDLYSTATLPKGLDKEIMFLPCMHCGGFMEKLQSNVIWFSSGGTASVIHNDPNQNIHCMLDGQKDWILWHPKSKIDNPDGSLGWTFAEQEAKKDPKNPKWKDTYGSYAGNIDVDNVDVVKYPKWKELKSWKIDMQAGDCAFVPGKWFHYVTAPKQRSISVHYWFGYSKTFDTKSCDSLAARGYNISEPAYNLGDCQFGWEDPDKKVKKTKCNLPEIKTAAGDSKPEL